MYSLEAVIVVQVSELGKQYLADIDVKVVCWEHQGDDHHQVDVIGHREYHVVDFKLQLLEAGFFLGHILEHEIHDNTHSNSHEDRHHEEPDGALQKVILNFAIAVHDKERD